MHEGEGGCEGDALQTDRAGPHPPGAMAEKVLLVDDDPALLEVLEHTLERGGFATAAAASGEEALQLLARDQFDAALVDKNLAGIDGVEVLRHLRKRQPACACVVMTGQPSLASAV